jgi:predicted enzyme related to lactoylglutathione lyase
MTANGFVWYELVTKDIDAALAFYGSVLGWESTDFPGGEQRYAIVSAKGKGVGGVMTLPCEMPPCWIGYVGTPDIDQAAARVTAAGGTVQRGPFEIPTVGRIALITDPQGAGLALFQGASDRSSEAFNQALPGHGNWHELRTSDPVAGFAFYAGQFGWTKGEAMDMGPMGMYQIFKSGDAQIGGMMKGMESEPPSWLFYFGTENVPGAIKRITDGGGTVLHGPVEVPGGAQIVQARDPQGAMFAVVGPG